MSKCYHIECTDCEKTLWVGQRNYIYVTTPEITAFAKFLHDHEKHNLRFVNSENIDEDFEDLSNYN